MLILKDVTIEFGKSIILKGINLTINEGEILGIVGPNGSGKSTLLNTIAQTIKFKGEMYYKNKTSHSFTQRQWAKNIGLLEQKYQIPEEYSVFDLVMMGNYIHKKWWEFDNFNDKQRVLTILNELNLNELKDHSFKELSGGEQQRVMLARMLLHSPEIILLDEPTNHLDIYFQIELLKQIRSKFNTIVAVLHDLNLAATYCDKIVLINKGQIVDYGTSDKVLNEINIKQYFNVKTKLIHLPNQSQKIISLYHSLEENK